MKQLINTLILTVFLFSCGGSGGSSTTSPTTPTPTPDNTSGIFVLADTVSIGDSVELFLYYPNNALQSISWKQISGPTVNLLTPTTKAIAFTGNEQGNFTFEVTFSLDGGEPQSLTKDITVTDEVSSMTARIGHAVLSGGKVSLRTWLSDEVDASSIQWQQVDGPSVTFTSEDTTGEQAVFFDAPQVTTDTLITFNVTANKNSNSIQDSVAVLVEGAEAIEEDDDRLFGNRVATVFPYNEDSPYADVLTDCTYSNELYFSNTCRLSSLPLLAHDTLTPSVDDIMDRVVVSHQWMGDKFKAFLEEYDNHNDFKNLLRATTAIVLSYDIRPSFYWGATGAIYIDGGYLWLTKDERDTINEAPDYRSAFGKELQFLIPWRYVKDNNYVNRYYSPDFRTDRTLESSVYNLISLLYHELAHANDFFPSHQWAQYKGSERILDALISNINRNGTQSDLLTESMPLSSQEMLALAQVDFHGETSTATQNQYTPADVATFFKPDTAPQYYNYSSTREDYAMLFDGFMMNARYGIERDVAITDSEYLVSWGQRGRIGNEEIKPRVAFAVTRILPDYTEAQNVLDALPEPVDMTPGLSWSENLTISTMIHQNSIAGALLRKELQSSAKLRPQELDLVVFKEIALSKSR